MKDYDYKLPHSITITIFVFGGLKKSSCQNNVGVLHVSCRKLYRVYRAGFCFKQTMMADFSGQEVKVVILQTLLNKMF